MLTGTGNPDDPLLSVRLRLMDLCKMRDEEDQEDRIVIVFENEETSELGAIAISLDDCREIADKVSGLL